MKIPFNIEVQSILAKCHMETNHKGINIMRLNIINQGWYWEGLDKDISLFIQDCSLCIQIDCSKHLKPPIKQIISTNHERYVIDLWELPPEITDIYPYKFIIDIIDHFSKYIATYPLTP